MTRRTRHLARRLVDGFVTLAFWETSWRSWLIHSAAKETVYTTSIKMHGACERTQRRPRLLPFKINRRAWVTSNYVGKSRDRARESENILSRYVLCPRNRASSSNSIVDSPGITIYHRISEADVSGKDDYEDIRFEATYMEARNSSLTSRSRGMRPPFRLRREFG